MSVRRIRVDSVGWALVALLGGILAGAIPALLAEVPQGALMFWSGLTGLTVSCITVLWIFARRGDVLAVLPLLAVYHLLEFVVGGLYFQRPRPGAGSGVLGGFLGTYTPAGFNQAIGLACLGWLAVVAGYATCSFMRAAKRLPQPSIELGSLLPIAYCLLAIGWLARLLLVQRGLYFHISTTAGELEATKSGNIIRVVADLPLVATALVAAAHYRGHRVQPAVLWALLASEALWAVPSGERSRLVALGLMLLIVRYYSPRPMSPRLVLLGGLAVVFLLFPFGAIYRGVGGQSGYQTDPTAQLRSATATLLSRSPSEFIQTGLQETASRFSGAASLATMASQGRDLYPNTQAQTLNDWASAFVPRFALPSKSDPSLLGNAYGRAYGIYSSRQLNTGNASVTHVGDFYGSFGWWGATLGMFLVGGLVRGVEEYFRDRSRTALFGVYAATVGTLVLGFETTVAVGTLQALKEILIALGAIAAVAWIVQTRAGPTTSS